MENGAIVFAFAPNLSAAAGIYGRLLEAGVDGADISVLTHHEFAEHRREPIPALSPCRGGLAGQGSLLDGLDPNVGIFDALSQALLGSSKKMGTIKAALLLGETLLVVRARNPAQLETARLTLDPTLAA